jgi:hypothetical protein
MKRAGALLVVALAAGCGAGPGETPVQSGSPPNEKGPHGKVSAALSVGDAVAKVVVKATVNVARVVYADNGYWVACVVDADCADYVGAFCAESLCKVSVPETTIIYSNNYPVIGGAVSFPIPCDGTSYAAEVYGGSTTGTVTQVSDAYRSGPIVVAPSTCVVTTAPAWTAIPFPVLNVPEIFVGLPPPSDTYIVSVNGMVYPWSGPFALTVNGSPVPTLGTRATVIAPSTTAAQTLMATFGLDRSLLVSGDGTWQLQSTVTATPVGSAPISGP